MAKIFISYSRVDTAFLEKLYPHLGRKYGYENVWYDDRLHGGDDWWQTILDHVGWGDIFVYLLSNESVTSEYCQAEFQEAQRLNKFIVTIQVRDRTKLDDQLSAIQYIDMNSGLNVDAMTRLFTAIDRVDVETIRKKRARWKGQTPKPGTTIQAEKVERSDVDTPTLKIARPTISSSQEKRGCLNEPVAIILAAIITGIFGLLAAWIAIRGNQQPTATPEATTEVAIVASATPEVATESAIIASERPEATTEVATLATGTPISPVDATLTEIYRQATEAGFLTRFAFTPTETHSAEIIATGAVETETAIGTQNVIATKVAERLATDTTWTPTPTSLPPLPDPLEVALQRASTRMSSNNQWEAWYPEGFVQKFDGVDMVLVPTGCFTIGTNSEADDNDICFAEPFWVDRYEVTNTDFAVFLDEKDSLGENGFEYLDADDEDARIRNNDGNWEVISPYGQHPVTEVTWFAARDYCLWRGGRLQTEAEWEFVARGPDELDYPWGAEWDGSKAVWDNNHPETTNTAPVGSIPEGSSWVGAVDMSGNVWEWVSSLYLDYPYGSDHESADNSTSVRVLRGGSWNYVNTLILRATNRSWYHPSSSDLNLGMRCARDL